MITFSQFQEVEIRVGTILEARVFEEARSPALLLKIDFGEPLGVLQSSAQITRHYLPDQLVGTQVLAVTNLPARQIGPRLSQVLVLGVDDGQGGIRLVRPDVPVPRGQRLH